MDAKTAIKAKKKRKTRDEDFSERQNRLEEYLKKRVKEYNHF